MRRVLTVLGLLWCVASQAATVGQTTPLRGSSLPGMCDTLHVLQRGDPCRAHVRISLAGTRVWEDSTGVEIGSAWTITYPDPKPGTYDRLHWYSVDKGLPGCPHLQTLVVNMAYRVDPLWTMYGAIFDSRGMAVNVYDIAKTMNAYTDSVEAHRISPRGPQ